MEPQRVLPSADAPHPNLHVPKRRKTGVVAVARRRRGAHLEAVEGAVVFEGEDVVRDGEEVSLSCDQAPDVHGLGCDGGREGGSGTQVTAGSFILQDANASKLMLCSPQATF